MATMPTRPVVWTTDIGGAKAIRDAVATASMLTVYLSGQGEARRVNTAALGDPRAARGARGHAEVSEQ
jgi:hypothetical protein